MNSVTVQVKFMGSISKAVGKDRMQLATSADLETAIGDVKQQILAAASDLLYTMLIGGMHYSIALKQGINLQDGDEITVIPVTLGG